MTTYLPYALGALAVVFILMKALSPRRPFVMAQFTTVILLWFAWGYGVWRFVLFPDGWTPEGFILLGWIIVALLLPVLLSVTPRHIRRFHSTPG
jgi:hypothetical protein